MSTNSLPMLILLQTTVVVVVGSVFRNMTGVLWIVWMTILIPYMIRIILSVRNS